MLITRFPVWCFLKCSSPLYINAKYWRYKEFRLCSVLGCGADKLDSTPHHILLTRFPVCGVLKCPSPLYINAEHWSYKEFWLSCVWLRSDNRGEVDCERGPLSFHPLIFLFSFYFVRHLLFCPLFSISFSIVVSYPKLFIIRFLSFTYFKLLIFCIFFYAFQSIFSSSISISLLVVFRGLIFPFYFISHPLTLFR